MVAWRHSTRQSGTAVSLVYGQSDAVILTRGEFATWVAALSQQERSLPTIFTQLLHTRFVLRIPDPREIELTPISPEEEIFNINSVSNHVGLTPAPVPAHDIVRKTMAHELHFRSSHTSVYRSAS